MKRIVRMLAILPALALVSCTTTGVKRSPTGISGPTIAWWRYSKDGGAGPLTAAETIKLAAPTTRKKPVLVPQWRSSQSTSSKNRGSKLQNNETLVLDGTRPDQGFLFQTTPRLVIGKPGREVHLI